MMSKKSLPWFSLFLMITILLIAGCGSSGGGGGDSTPNPFAGEWAGGYSYSDEDGTASITIDTNGNFSGKLNSDSVTGTCDKNGYVNLSYTTTTGYKVTITGTFQKSNDKLALTNGKIAIASVGEYTLSATLWPSTLYTKIWEGPYSVTNGITDTGTITVNAISKTDGSLWGQITSNSLGKAYLLGICDYDGTLTVSFSLNSVYTLKGTADMVNGKLVISSDISGGGNTGKLTATLSAK